MHIQKTTAQQDLSIGGLLRIMKAGSAAVTRSVDPIFHFSGGEASDVKRGLDSFIWKLLDSSGADLAKLFGWCAAFLAALVVLFWGIVRVRSLYRDDDDPAAVDQSMLLGLGDLHRQGDLTESEYRSIKSQLIQRMQDPPSHDTQKQP